MRPMTPSGALQACGRGGLALALVISGLACDSDVFDTRPAGFRLTTRTGGPKVIFDLDARPLPEIPFPNDLATLPDPSTPTGRRLNITEVGETQRESDLRAKANQLDGFGLFAPITVQFDARIDVEDLRARHNNHDLIDDAVYVINIDRDSSGFGERMEVDLGKFVELPEEMRVHPEQRAPTAGRFPNALDAPNQYFDHDPRGGTSSLVFETVQEANTDGLFTEAEDTDGDGVLDRPNRLSNVDMPRGSTEEADAILPFYELETNTLIIRTVMPLREATTYAVVLSRHIKDTNGRSIQSPFDYVNHTRQTDDLAPVSEVLPRHGLQPEDVAFMWSFTTQSATREMEMIRRGLYNNGPLSWLATQFPPVLNEIWPWTTPEAQQTCRENANGNAEREARCEMTLGVRVLDTGKLLTVLGPLASILVGENGAALLGTFRYVDYLVAGTYVTPYFLVDRDGLADGVNPQDDDESFEIDLEAGTAVVGDDHKVSFWCTIPKSLEYTDLDGTVKRHEPPFPVVLYGHGYGGSRLEMLGFAGHHARFGLATCATDAAGHGLTLPPEVLEQADMLLPALLGPQGIEPEQIVHNVTTGRHRDLNNDGVADSGGDFWTEDVFHTRDMVRQSAVDWLQLVRVLRSFDGRLTAVDLDGDGELNEVAGDFNGDGVPDMGGPDNDFFSWGQSLGGIMSVLAPAVEPSMVAAAPTAGGAGLVDIAMRSIERAVPRVVVLRMMGPIILGDPIRDEGGEPTGRFQFNWLVPDTSPPGAHPEAARIPIGEATLQPGDVVAVRNLTREANELLPAPDRRFDVVEDPGAGLRMHMAADAWSATEKRGILGLKPHEPDFTPLTLTEQQVLASGDRFLIEIYDAGADTPREVIDAWAADTEWQGIIYPAGAPLVAPASGYGYIRQTPGLRRYFGIAQAILDSGDPGSYAARYFRDPIDLSDMEPDRNPETRALIITTTGDQLVPVNAGLALARVMGVIDFEKPRGDLYGLTEDEFLMAVGAYEGTVTYPRWWDDEGPYNFDVDDLDDGTDELATDPRGNFKLRLTKRTPRGGISGLRMPYMGRSNRDPGVDAHGIDTPDPTRPFDVSTFTANMVSLFFLKRGQGITERDLSQPCLQFLGDNRGSCKIAPLYPE